MHTTAITVTHRGTTYQLTQTQADEIGRQYQIVLNEDGPGAHWVLMAVLDKAGIRTHSTVDAMRIAAQVY